MATAGQDGPGTYDSDEEQGSNEEPASNDEACFSDMSTLSNHSFDSDKEILLNAAYK